MITARAGPAALRTPMVGQTKRRGISALVIALSLACGADAGPTIVVQGPVAPALPAAPSVPSSAPLQRVDVTTVTTGVHLDPDGYGILNDEWDYDVGDGVTVSVPANGTVSLYLRPGAHVLSVVNVESNCHGENIGDRPITVPSGADVTTVVFQLVCA